MNLIVGRLTAIWRLFVDTLWLLNWKWKELCNSGRKTETLKEYFEIVAEARPLSGFFPTHADFFTEMHF